MRESRSEEVAQLKTYRAWDAAVRSFHWINLLCFLGLVALGLAILNDKALGLDREAKILLKTVHVWIGYAFVLNLVFRMLWATVGPAQASWRMLLPGGRRYLEDLRGFIADWRANRPRQYIGHNPLGRLSVLVLIILLLAQAVTGLILAGTDLFMPPLGGWLAAKVAAPGVDPASLVPYAPQLYDATAIAAMRGWRSMVAELHEIAFYGLLVTVAVHITGVVVGEFREGTGLVSAMITGKKSLSSPPVDDPEKR